MNVPPLVRDRLEDESAVARVPLGGDDAVFLTPTRTLVYRAEGLLSDETVATYPHDVERLDVSQGRRKATFELTYVDTAGKFTVPAGRTDDVLPPLLGGILAAAGVTDDDERVREAYRFSELTVVVTDGRLLKHVGSALWDADHESYPFADVTGLGVEEGSVATQLVVEVDGRPNRVKVPSEDAPSVERALETAVFEFHDVESVAELREKQGVVDEPDESRADAFEESGIAPLVGDDDESDEAGAETAGADADAGDASQASGAATTDGATTGDGAATAGDANGAAAGGAGREAEAADASTTATPAASGSGDATDDRSEVSDSRGGRSEVGGSKGGDSEIVERLERLERVVERQNELVESQRETIQTLVDELRRGR